MKYGMIATWKMAFDGVELGRQQLMNGGSADQAVIAAIMDCENNPSYKSVGTGGYTNSRGVVELDAAFMDGDTLRLGAVTAVKCIKNPIKLAKHLSKFNRNNILTSTSAEEYAITNGFEIANLLSDEMKKQWLKRKEEGFDSELIEAYGGHDTVCIIGKDQTGRIVNGVSTAGLFMKHPGRVGDSTIIGSGFYCDSKVGAASATGVGEDIMKGCLSLRIVMLMKAGCGCQEACEKILFDHYYDMKERGIITGSMSVIAMDKEGNFGGATTKKEFPFVVTTDHLESTIFVARFNNDVHSVKKADDDWMKNYKGD